MGSVAVVINLQNSSRSLTFSLADVGFTSVSAVDLWTGAHLGTLNTSFVMLNHHHHLTDKISYTLIRPGIRRQSQPMVLWLSDYPQA